MQFVPHNATIPPKIGDYGYYDSRISQMDLNNSSNNIEHFLIATKFNPNLTLGCHYSLNEEKENRPFIKSLGIIVKLKKL